MKCQRCGKEMKNTIGGNYHCDSCGLAVNDLVYRPTAGSSHIYAQPTTDNNSTNPSFGDYPGVDFWAQRGWICPKCGAVMSPSMSFCPFCSPKQEITISYATGTNNLGYPTDWTKQQTTTGTDSGQYINPNTSTTISKER